MTNVLKEIDIPSSREDLDPRFYSTSSHNPFVNHDSPSRTNMDSSHMASRLPLINPEKKQTCFSGVEYELGKYIDDVRVPYDCVIRSVIPKYQTLGELSPDLILIVERDVVNDDGTEDIMIDAIEVPFHKANNAYFGYTLEATEELKAISYNKNLPKGTILAKAASYGDDGSYMYGFNANVVFTSALGAGEDGIMMRRGFAEKLKYHSYTKRVFYLDRDNFPVNAHGDLEQFKFVPDIGEKVKAGGLLCAIRERKKLSSVTDLNNRNICRVNDLTDIANYVDEDSVVIDIKVMRASGKIIYSENMREQLDKYYYLNVANAQAIVKNYRNIVSDSKKRSRSGTYVPRYSSRYINLVTDAMVYIDSEEPRGARKFSVNKREIEQYRVEVTLMAVMQPDRGMKLAGIHGDELICPVTERSVTEYHLIAGTR